MKELSIPRVKMNLILKKSVSALRRIPRDKMNLILKKRVSGLRRISVNYLHFALVSMETEIL